MTDRPRAGGRYVREDGKLKLVQRTLPPEPDQVPPGAGAATAAPKPAPKRKEA